MNPSANTVLVVPRYWFANLDGFIPWARAQTIFNTPTENAKWLPRAEAEVSTDWVQPIPCTIFMDPKDQCCLLRYPGRPHRFTIVVGGHIDNTSLAPEFEPIFLNTLQREIQEEVHLPHNPLPQPIGLAVDSSSIAASRHIGIVYKTITSALRIKPLAQDEFSKDSDYSGIFMPPQQIEAMVTREKYYADPWSTIILSEYLLEGSPRTFGRQAGFLL